MTKDNFLQGVHRHFIVWFVALFIFAFFEWRHPGFVSYVLPFPVLVLLPGIILAGGYAASLSLKK